jgi:hypothetical protein
MSSDTTGEKTGPLAETFPPEITQEAVDIATARAEQVVDLLGRMPDDWRTFSNAIKALEAHGSLPSYEPKDNGD